MKGLIRLGRREGVAGSSLVWEVRRHGRVHRMDRQGLQDGLASGWLTGIESVRREDGDWGPLFGRPLYRELFDQGADEPRDHAKARARERAAERAMVGRRWLLVTGLLFVASLPFGASPVGQGVLLLTLVCGVVTGWYRLLWAVQVRELEDLTESLVPPVLPPPEPVDWEKLVAEEAREAAQRD